MDTGNSTPGDNYVPSPNEGGGNNPAAAAAAAQQEDCSILSPTLADILSDDRILRFYQCVKDIKTQGSPKQTAAMFFALCHALGDTVSFLKVPNMSKIMFRQEQQIFAVNVSGTQHDTVHMFDNQQQQQQQPLPATSDITAMDNTSGAAAAASGLLHDVDSTHNSNSSNIFSASATDGSPQHLLQAALSSVTQALPDQQQQQQQITPAANTVTTASKKRNAAAKNDDGTVTTKRAKKASPRDKEYGVRRNEVIQDLLKVSEPDLLHQANIVDSEVKLIIQGHERSTKFGALSPIHRFSAFANLPAHLDCDFAPKNAGVYYNYEYFQLYLAYRDLEAERQQQQQMEGGDPRPVLAQCRADIERVLVNTNWEAIRRRLTIGERICQVCGVVGRGFLLLSKQVSGRKLLHNFNTGEWGEFMREFQKPENQPLLQTLQTKYSPERFYGPRQELMLSAATAATTEETGESSTNNTDNNSSSNLMTMDATPANNNSNAPSTTTTPAPDAAAAVDDDSATIGAVAAAVAAAVSASEVNTPTSAPTDSPVPIKPDPSA